MSHGGSDYTIGSNHIPKKSHANSNNIQYLIYAVVGTVVAMCFLFGIFYWYQRKKWEIKKIQQLVHVKNSGSRSRQIPVVNVLNSMLKNDHGHDVHQQFKWPEGNRDGERIQKLWQDPESFDNIMKNSAVVQNAVLDDIHEEMETEGATHIKTEIQENCKLNNCNHKSCMLCTIRKQHAVATNLFKLDNPSPGHQSII